jgi:single-stranded-DNA-specific exonuclease
MAAGLSMSSDHVDAFRQGINEAAKGVNPSDFIPHNEIVGELEHEMINFQLLELLEKFEPYGEGNPRPRFLIRNADVVAVKLFGSDQSHSRIELRPSRVSQKTLELIAFRRTLECPEDKKISCSYTVNKNEWNGRVSLQLMVERVF